MKRSLLCVAIISTMFVVAGCSDDKDEPWTQPEATTPVPSTDLTARSFVSVDKKNATVQFESSKGTKLDYLVEQDADGKKKITQAVTTEATGLTTRTFFDASGNIERIVDEKTGDFVQFYWQDNRLIVTNHDANGVYQNGSVISYDQDGKAGIAQIIGKPSFSGQIVGNVNSADPGAYTLVPKNQIDELELITGEFQALPAEFQALLKADTVTPRAASTRATDVSAADAFSWINDAWKNSVAEVAQQNRKQLFATFVIGAALAPTVPTIGVAVGGFSAAMLIGGYVAQQSGLRVMNDVNADLGLPLVGESLRTQLDRLSDVLLNALQQGKNLVDETTNAVKTIQQQGINKLPNYIDLVTKSATSSLALQTIKNKADLLAAKPVPVVDTPVTGILANNSGQTYTLDGKVAKDGNVDVKGQQTNGSLQVELQGTIAADKTITGTYSNNAGDTGSLTGDNNALGACATRQEAGYQGSFSYAFSMGSGKGDVTASYDMYGIPDRMDVFTLNGENRVQVFSTNGLVSYTGSSTFQVAPYTTVFVSMTAPNSGTAWEFRLTCPQ